MVVDTAHAKRLGNDIINMADKIERYQSDLEKLSPKAQIKILVGGNILNSMYDSTIMEDVKAAYISKLNENIKESSEALSTMIGGCAEPAKRKATEPR